MHTALTRLKAGTRNLESIAHQVGYRSSAAFQKAFKRVHGFTPAQATAA
jgi:AraC-like DNA-binding protein